MDNDRSTFVKLGMEVRGILSWFSQLRLTNSSSNKYQFYWVESLDFCKLRVLKSMQYFSP